MRARAGAASDVLLIQDAISEQVGTFLQYFSQFTVGILVGFVKVRAASPRRARPLTRAAAHARRAGR